MEQLQGRTDDAGKLIKEISINYIGSTTPTTQISTPTVSLSSAFPTMIVPKIETPNIYKQDYSETTTKEQTYYSSLQQGG